MIETSSENNKKYSREDLQKKLLYKSNYRGCKETDLILGNFAKLHLDSLTDEEMNLFSQIVELQDTDLYDWFTNKKPLPEKYDNSIMQRLIQSAK